MFLFIYICEGIFNAVVVRGVGSNTQNNSELSGAFLGFCVISYPRSPPLNSSHCHNANIPACICKYILTCLSYLQISEENFCIDYISRSRIFRLYKLAYMNLLKFLIDLQCSLICITN